MTPDGRTAAAPSSFGIGVWDIGSGKLVARLICGVSHWVSLTGDGRTVAFGTQNAFGTWDVASGKVNMLDDGKHGSGSHPVVFTPDGKTLLCGLRGGGLGTWNLGSGEQLKAILKLEGGTPLPPGAWRQPRPAVAITPDGRAAVAVNAVYRTESGNPVLDRSTIEVWDLPSGKLVRSDEFERPGPPLVFSQDGKTALIGNVGGLKLWDVEMGVVRASMEGHENHILAAAFGHDMKTAVSLSADATMKVWDLGSARVPRTHHAVPIDSVALSRDDLVAASAGRDSIKVWNCDSGREARILGHAERSVEQLTFSSDSRTLVAVLGSTVRSFALETGSTEQTVIFGEVLPGTSAQIAAMTRAVNGLPPPRITERDQVFAEVRNGAGEIVRTFTEAWRGAPNAGGFTAILTNGGEKVLWTFWEHVVRVMDRATGQVIGAFNTDHVVADIKISPDGATAVLEPREIFDIGSGRNSQLSTTSAMFSQFPHTPNCSAGIGTCPKDHSPPVHIERTDSRLSDGRSRRCRGEHDRRNRGIDLRRPNVAGVESP